MTLEQGGPRHFHAALADLKSKLLEMSGVAEEQLRLAVEALSQGDVEGANAVVDGDRKVDALELEIDKGAHELLALQQPLAGDLRFITMTMKISNDLERVGDHAANIARTVSFLTGLPPSGRIPEILEMTSYARKMLAEALDAFVRRDPELARAVCAADVRMNQLYNSIFRILITFMMEDPRRISHSMSLLLISKNLERIADLATNIAEDVVFLVEGVVIKHPGQTRPGEENRQG
jgi:phosphate transport system protein